MDGVDGWCTRMMPLCLSASASPWSLLGGLCIAKCVDGSMGGGGGSDAWCGCMFRESRKAA